MMCEVLGVSRSGYYTWKTREPSARAKEREEREVLEREITEIHRKSRGTYGSPRVHHELQVDFFFRSPELFEATYVTDHTRWTRIAQAP